jgi:hypothetical protein
MSTPSKHPQTIALPHCWVCGALFIEHGGVEHTEHHHIIPQAYGGADGPTVSLCEKHHQSLHKIALCLKGNKPHFMLLANHTQEQRTKLMFLATRVHEAEQLTRNDPNKRAMLVLSLDREMTKMIDDLKTVLPGVKSREAVVRSAVKSLWNRHFMGNNQTGS